MCVLTQTRSFCSSEPAGVVSGSDPKVGVCEAAEQSEVQQALWSSEHQNRTTDSGQVFRSDKYFKRMTSCEDQNYQGASWEEAKQVVAV